MDHANKNSSFNGPSSAAQPSEHWPPVAQPKEYRELARSSVMKYHELEISYADFLPRGTYTPFCDFLNYGCVFKDNYAHANKLGFDGDGIVMLQLGGGFHYNPVTIAQYGLTLYGGFLYGEQRASAFLRQADFLLQMQNPIGTFPYHYDYPYYVAPEKYYRAGWVSAMANGNALSLWARAYHVTGLEKYRSAAKNALQFLKIPIEQGGALGTLAYLDPSLDGYVIYEEFPALPQTYTLNGYMYTLIGIYDWLCIPSDFQDLAKQLFDDGIRTLEKILPYYDIGGFTSYDLSHITYSRTIPNVGVYYHREHVAFCKIFYDLTGIDTFRRFYGLWASYVDNYSMPQNPMIDQNWREDFLIRYPKVYIYGAGAWGRYLFTYHVRPSRHAGAFKGFVVSDGHRKISNIDGYRIYELSEIHLDEETGLMIAVENPNDIKAALDEKGFPNYTLLDRQAQHAE